MPKMRRLVPLLGLLAVAALLLVASEDLAHRVAAPVSARAPTLPQLLPAPGVFAESTTVTLRPSEASRQIVFTTDGSAPTLRVGALYERPLRFGADFAGVRILRAIEVEGEATGPVLSASYAIGLAPTLPIVSLIVEPADLWDADRGLFANPSWRGQDWERPVHMTTFLDGADYALPAGLRIDGREAQSAQKQSLRLYFRSEYEASRLIAPLFPDHPHRASGEQSFKRLLLQAGDHGVTWSLLRDQVVGQVARDLGLPAVEGRFVWLFVNGSTWGIYRLTERVTRFMLADSYGIAEADVIHKGNAREGSEEGWEALLDWVDAHDLADPNAYDVLASQVDMANLVDIAILWRLFDLPREALVAVQPQGGRWLWVFEGGAESQTVGRASDFGALQNALMANPAYRRRFAARMADLLNTTLSPDALDVGSMSFAGAVAATFEQERGRWPGVPTWEHEAAAMRVYVERRRGEVSQQAGISVPVAVEVGADEAGRVYVNGARMLPASSGWVGMYPQGALVELVAVPMPGERFRGWEGVEGVDTSSTLITLTVGAPITLTARFGPETDRGSGPRPDDVIINELWINDDGTRHATLNYLPLEGDWVELLVTAPHGVDMRGWRLTDNDTKTGTSEGSIIFPDDEVWAAVPCGTVILIIATETPLNADTFPTDDLNPRTGVMRLYVGNGNLDVTTDPGFGLGVGNDNVALLAPGPSAAFDDDIGIDFVAEGRRVTPATFGILADGVTFDEPFTRLGADDGALFAGMGSNDDLADWMVDPPACSSGDAQCYGYPTLVTPGALNPAQRGYRLGCFLRRLGLP